MGMAPVAHVVWNKFMTFNPKNPEWVNRDRFILSYVPCKFRAFRVGSLVNGWRWTAERKLWQLKPTPATFSADIVQLSHLLFAGLQELRSPIYSFCGSEATLPRYSGGILQWLSVLASVSSVY